MSLEHSTIENENPLVVDRADMALEICSRLQYSDVLALDCEGVNLGPTGNLTLAQISTPDNRAWIFDFVECSEMAEILRPIFESERILKIVHDCRAERSNLREQFGIQLRNVFDTQIGFHMMKPLQNDRISLTNLCRYYKVPKNPLKDMFQSDFYERNPGFWARRPLSALMIQYATADIAQLHVFYGKMKRFENNINFRQMCEDANLYEADLYVNGQSGQRNPKLRLFV